MHYLICFYSKGSCKKRIKIPPAPSTDFTELNLKLILSYVYRGVCTVYIWLIMYMFANNYKVNKVRVYTV